MFGGSAQPSPIIPNRLYLGDELHGCSRRTLRLCGVTRVLSVGERAFELPGVLLMHHAMSDYGRSNLTRLLPSFFRFIDESLARNQCQIDDTCTNTNPNPNPITNTNSNSNNNDPTQLFLGKVASPLNRSPVTSPITSPSQSPALMSVMYNQPTYTLSPHSASPQRSTCASSSGAVLVHCAAGANRSPVVVIAYLIARCGLTLAEAATHVKSLRPQTHPCISYMEQLLTLEYECFGSNSWKLSEFAMAMQGKPSVQTIQLTAVNDTVVVSQMPTSPKPSPKAQPSPKGQPSPKAPPSQMAPPKLVPPPLTTQYGTPVTLPPFNPIPSSHSNPTLFPPSKQNALPSDKPAERQYTPFTIAAIALATALGPAATGTRKVVPQKEAPPGPKLPPIPPKHKDDILMVTPIPATQSTNTNSNSNISISTSTKITTDPIKNLSPLPPQAPLTNTTTNMPTLMTNKTAITGINFYKTPKEKQTLPPLVNKKHSPSSLPNKTPHKPVTSLSPSLSYPGGSSNTSGNTGCNAKWDWTSCGVHYSKQPIPHTGHQFSFCRELPTLPNSCVGAGLSM
ncbi:hypothetical protein Pelo_188 [Pelomyxa schiedti]|nr:hypothetical protein Pelo_188 [Pelomyxa schiedti]